MIGLGLVQSITRVYLPVHVRQYPSSSQAHRTPHHAAPNSPPQSPSWPPSSTGRLRTCRRSCSRYMRVWVDYNVIWLGRPLLPACRGLARSTQSPTGTISPNQPNHDSSSSWSTRRRTRRTSWSGSRCSGSGEAAAAARRAGQNRGGRWMDSERHGTLEKCTAKKTGVMNSQSQQINQSIDP